jgi:hypothetical protein
MGPAFALYRPFYEPNGAVCPIKADCATQGDSVCDTDPTAQNFCCRSGTDSCTGTPYSINTENNFMSYTSGALLFTAGQKVQMLSAAAASFRSYTGSWALSAIYPGTSFNMPIAASCTPVYTGTSLTSSYAGGLNLTLYRISVTTSTSFIDGGNRNNTA